MNQELRIVREVALAADDLRPAAEELGRAAADTVRARHGNAQLKGLESLAGSTLKVSDVLDYVKIRVARSRERGDRGWPEFGPRLLEALDTNLRRRSNRIQEDLGLQPMERQWVHLQLIREFLRQMMAHCLFEATLRDGEGKP